MSKKKPELGYIPLESILLDLVSPTYANDPYRAHEMRKELTAMLGRSELEKKPDGYTKPARLTDAEHFETLGTPAMEELQRAAFELDRELHIAKQAKKNVGARYDQPGGSREQKAKHREAYQAAYDAGEYTTHSSFAKAHAGKPGFAVSEKVLAQHLKGLRSGRKK